MHQVDQKKLLVSRITAHLNPKPDNVVQELLQQSVQELEIILDKLATTKAKVKPMRSL
jgi:hypothetical protein